MNDGRKRCLMAAFATVSTKSSIWAVGQTVDDSAMKVKARGRRTRGRQEDKRKTAKCQPECCSQRGQWGQGEAGEAWRDCKCGRVRGWQMWWTWRGEAVGTCKWRSWKSRVWEHSTGARDSRWCSSVGDGKSPAAGWPLCCASEGRWSTGWQGATLTLVGVLVCRDFKLF